MIKTLNVKAWYEAYVILEYLKRKYEGEHDIKPPITTRVHRDSLKYIEKLFKSEENISLSAKELLDIVASLSDFDVQMDSMSGSLTDFSKDIAELSESNLAVIEETTAGMSQVNDTISYTSSKLDELATTSGGLVESNNLSLGQLIEINELMGNVLSDAEIMSQQIKQLVELAGKVSNIVSEVETIANQTNLLALNASIEAARAGENGRGFSVVAEQIRKLADNTRTNLSGMSEFVENIHEASENGFQSVNRTISSTKRINEKINNVSETVEKNVTLMNEAISDLSEINKAIAEIKIASEEIDKAMGYSGQDTEKLNNMTKLIYSDAMQISDQAKTVSEVDDKLSNVVKRLINTLNGGSYAISNDDFLENMKTARIAHEKWMSNLKQITDEMKTYPLQTDDTKCKFGHFYHSITIENPDVKEMWNRLGVVHKKLHESAIYLFELVEGNDATKALEQYKYAKSTSEEIFAIIDEIMTEVDNLSKKGINLL